MNRLAFLCLFLLAACGQNSSQGKSLFSYWVAEGGQRTLDLRSAKFGSSEMTIILVSGTECKVTLTLEGKEDRGSGSIEVDTSGAIGGHGIGGECGELAGDFWFAKSSDVLAVRFNSVVSNYR